MLSMVSMLMIEQMLMLLIRDWVLMLLARMLMGMGTVLVLIAVGMLILLKARMLMLKERMLMVAVEEKKLGGTIVRHSSPRRSSPQTFITPYLFSDIHHLRHSSPPT